MNCKLVFAFPVAYNRTKYIYSQTGYFTSLGCTQALAEMLNKLINVKDTGIIGNANLVIIAYSCGG